MKNILASVILIIAIPVVAQQSYDFAKPVPPSSDEIKSVERSYYGLYKGELALEYEFSVEGIVVISLNVNSISRETIRESSQYQVRNSYIFGVEENDSLPCVLDGERYYFGVRNRKVIVGAGSKNKLIQLSSKKYVVNFYSEGAYIPMYFTFSRRKLKIQQFDYPTETKKSPFKTVFSTKERRVNNLEVITLNPTPEEWRKLRLASFVGEERIFKRE